MMLEPQNAPLSGLDKDTRPTCPTFCDIDMSITWATPWESP